MRTAARRHGTSHIRNLLLVTLIVYSLTSAAASRAEIVTWDFQGITSDDGLPSGPCLPVGCQDIANGTSFSGYITFDSDAPNLGDSAEGFYKFSGAPNAFVIDIGSYVYSPTSFTIAVNPIVDLQQLVIDAGPSNGFTAFSMDECAESGTLITSTALPTDPPRSVPGDACLDPNYLSTSTDHQITMDFTNEVRAPTAVPEPSGELAYAVGVALALLLMRTRRRTSPAITRGHSARPISASMMSITP